MRALLFALVIALASCSQIGDLRPDHTCSDECDREDHACTAECGGLPPDCRQRCTRLLGECLHHCAAQGY